MSKLFKVDNNQNLWIHNSILCIFDIINDDSINKFALNSHVICYLVALKVMVMAFMKMVKHKKGH